MYPFASGFGVVMDVVITLVLGVVEVVVLVEVIGVVDVV
jgi:hypothetical protein